MKANSLEILDRIPPQSIEAEKGVLGSMLLDPQVCDDIALILTTSEDFYGPPHQRLFSHLLGMHNDGLRIDVTLLVERLTKAGDLDLVGGMIYLVEVLNSVPTAANAKYYAKIVREKAILRATIHAGTEAIREAYDPVVGAEEVARRAESRMARVLDRDGPRELVDGSAAIGQALTAARDSMAAKRRPGLFTGLSDFDWSIGGLHRGELYILAAKPSAGKTALALQVAIHAAEAGYRPLFVSLEMSARELMLRVLCGRAGVNSTFLRTGQLSNQRLAPLTEAAAELDLSRLLIDDRSAVTVADIRRTARQAKRQGDLSLVVVDYLQRLRPENPRVHRYEQVGEMTDGLKTMARELDLPVVCCCQLSREFEKPAGGKGSGDGKPRLSHLRESGNIEQDADVVAAVHRPEMLKPDDRDLAGQAELIVLKNRNGPTGTFDLVWDAASTTFRSAQSVF